MRPTKVSPGGFGTASSKMCWRRRRSLRDQLAEGPEHRPRGHQAAARRRMARDDRRGDRDGGARRRPCAWKRTTSAAPTKRSRRSGSRSSRATDADSSFLALAASSSARHRELAHADSSDWCGQTISTAATPTISTRMRETGARARRCRLPQALRRRTAEHRPDVRSLAIARETLAYHSRPRRLRLRHAGSRLGRDPLFGTIEQKREWLPKVASGEAIAAFAMTEPDMRLGRRQHRDLGDARRQRMGARRREDLHLQRRHRRFLRDLRAHRRGRRRARACPRSSFRPTRQRRGADRGHRAAPARAPEI